MGKHRAGLNWTDRRSGFDPEVIRSWQRSKQAGVPPDVPSLQSRDVDKLVRHRQRRAKLLQAAELYLQQLKTMLGTSRYAIGLTDDQAIVLRLLCDQKTARHPLFFEGANWSEGCIGTNGAGTALLCRRTIVISGPQHYCSGFHRWTSIAVPIKSQSLQVLGSLMVGVPDKQAHPYLVGMVIHAAHAIAATYADRDQTNLLTASLAHEARNPLTVARGFVQLVAQGNVPRQYKDYAAMALDNIDKATDILSNFTNLIKSRVSVCPVALDVTSSLQEVVACLEQIAASRNITFSLVCRADTPLVKADPKLLRCVWVNLYKNALESMSQGTIKTLVARANDKILIIISDQGPGIPREILANLFKPFYTHKATGTGLGLVICRDILASFQGSITIICPPTGGTKVKISLPAITSGD